MGFMPAVELSYIKPKNQRLIAVSIDGDRRPLLWTGRNIFGSWIMRRDFRPSVIPLYLPSFLNDAVSEEHKSGMDMNRNVKGQGRR